MNEAEDIKPPRYMAKLLEQMGWDQGTRIPLADVENQALENQLINRQNEMQKLKEALITQKQKRDDLKKYMHNINTECQENSRLLFAHKQQLEQELKLKQLTSNEIAAFERDIQQLNKDSKEVSTRIDRFQLNIARLLKKADTLKTEVCGERGALQEWRAALERNAGDIDAIEQFTKQDVSKAKALEYKRQKLKMEHDRMHERLYQLVSNLSAEERACERISVQVAEGMEQRKQMMAMWAAAVENLRQRDTDIRHTKEDYEVLEAASNKIADQCRELQAFAEQLRGNNAEATRFNVGLSQQLGQIKIAQKKISEENVTLDSEMQSLQGELNNIRQSLEKMRIQNRQIMEEQHKKDLAIQAVNIKMKELKEKLKDSLDKSKSSEKRAKELEDMLNDEERYVTQVTKSQQRGMHCSYLEQQKLLALKNEEKLCHMQVKAAKAIMSKLDNKQRSIEKELQIQKKTFYDINYQVETLGAQVCFMEGSQAEKESSPELVERENRLKDICARHAARLALLERHSARLHDDMRRTARELEARNAEHMKLQSDLRTWLLNVEGGEKELRESRGAWQRARVDEAMMRLRVAHAARALAGLRDTAFTYDEQRLQLEAAMQERLAEIRARRDVFSIQKRTLYEDSGKLNAEIKEREMRVEQLKKRYEIFIASLGKDESGQQVSVTFFKIKFAAERAMLRERGAALDAQVVVREREVAALEATLRVLHAAHTHFTRHVLPLTDEAPEIEELNNLTEEYYKQRDILKSVLVDVAALERKVSDTTQRLTALQDKCKLLTAREAETENELEGARERLSKQETRLQNAHEMVKYNGRRAKKYVDNNDEWRIFQMSVWLRDYAEAAQSAVEAIAETVTSSAAASHFAMLIASTDIQRLLAKHQRRLHTFLKKILSDSGSVKEETQSEVEESIFSSGESSKSGTSLASGYAKRLIAFRKTLGPKIQESSLTDDIPEAARRSKVSLRVVTLGLEETLPTAPTSSTRYRKSK